MSTFQSIFQGSFSVNSLEVKLDMVAVFKLALSEQYKEITVCQILFNILYRLYVNNDITLSFLGFQF